MTKKLLLPIVLLLLCTSLYADTYTLKGEIKVKKVGLIYFKLLTEKEFEADDKNEETGDGLEKDVAATAFLTIDVTAQDVKAKKVSFLIEDIPSGVYVIRCFQDINGNGMLDEGMFGPNEPFGNYTDKRPLFKAPEFDDFKFELKEDITDIQIKLK